MYLITELYFRDAQNAPASEVGARDPLQHHAEEPTAMGKLSTSGGQLIPAVAQRPAGISSSKPVEGGIFSENVSRRQSTTGVLTSRSDAKPYATELSLQA